MDDQVVEEQCSTVMEDSCQTVDEQVSIDEDHNDQLSWWWLIMMMVVVDNDYDDDDDNHDNDDNGGDDYKYRNTLWGMVYHNTMNATEKKQRMKGINTMMMMIMMMIMTAIMKIKMTIIIQSRVWMDDLRSDSD